MIFLTGKNSKNKNEESARQFENDNKRILVLPEFVNFIISHLFVKFLNTVSLSI